MSFREKKRLTGESLARLQKILREEPPEVSNAALAERFGLRPHTVARVRREVVAQCQPAVVP